MICRIPEIKSQLSHRSDITVNSLEIQDISSSDDNMVTFIGIDRNEWWNKYIGGTLGIKRSLTQLNTHQRAPVFNVSLYAIK